VENLFLFPHSAGLGNGTSRGRGRRLVARLRDRTGVGVRASLRRGFVWVGLDSRVDGVWPARGWSGDRAALPGDRSCRTGRIHWSPRRSTPPTSPSPRVVGHSYPLRTDSHLVMVRFGARSLGRIRPTTLRMRIRSMVRTRANRSRGARTRSPKIGYATKSAEFGFWWLRCLSS